jgi:hypothetical protein
MRQMGQYSRGIAGLAFGLHVCLLALLLFIPILELRADWDSSPLQSWNPLFWYFIFLWYGVYPTYIFLVR